MAVIVDIVQVLSDVVGAINVTPALTLTHGTPFEQNFDADNAVFPKVYLDEPLTSRVQLLAGDGQQNIYEVKLLFCDKAPIAQGGIDITPAQQRTILITQRQYAKEFIKRLGAAVHTDGRKIFNLSNGMEVRLTDVVRGMFDAHTIGIFLEMDLPVYDYNGVCI